MLDALAKLGLGGGIGFLLGVFLVLWVDPTTSGGVFLLIIVSVIACTIVGAIAAKLIKKGELTSDDGVGSHEDD